MARETLEEKAFRIAKELNLDPVNVLQGMQMQDIEFQMSIAPYMNYKGPIDTSAARVHNVPRGTPELSLLGYAIPADIPPELAARDQEAYSNTGDVYLFPKEAGTVNVIGEATPETWAHEYRHLTEKDAVLNSLGDGKRFNKKEQEIFRSKGLKQAREVNNRVLDIRNAQKPSEIEEAVNWLVNNDLDRLDDKKVKTQEEKQAKASKADYYLDLLMFPTKEKIKQYLSTEYEEFNKVFDDKGINKSPVFLKFMNDRKEEQAKTAKTFKEAL